MRVSLTALPLAAGTGLQLQINPVTRVAQLLDNLAKKLESDAKEEQKVYNKFECWCEKVQESKAASIASANERIGELNNYIDELNAGRVELTEERETLESEIQSLKDELKSLDDTRAKDNAEFLKNEQETQDAIDALTAAIPKLDAAISGHTEGVFFALSKGMVHMIRKSQTDLSEQDSRFLEEVLSQEDPNATGSNWDQKKLNRKATFKMGYKARSQKIRQILADMKTDFEKTLTDLRDAESKAVTDFTALRASRKDELDTTVTAKNTGAEEAAARNKARTESQDEVNDLTTANTDDERFVSQTQTTCAAKKTEFELRKEARKEEIASIREAISILRSDDARDTFKKSFSSQSFVQLESMSPKIALAATKIRQMAGTNLRLQALAESLARSGHFGAVIAKIDTMVVNLAAEQDQDLKDKQDCDKQRKDESVKAKDYSKQIDAADARIEELKADNARLQAEIKDTEAEIADAQEQKRQATSQREAEHADYLVAKADDQQGAALVQQAHDVLQSRQQALAATANGPDSLLQRRQMPGGEAPPPPPETFGGTYTGAKGETNGILAILVTIKEDIEKDIAKADAEEAAALAAYNQMVLDLNGAITERNAAITAMTGTIGENVEEIGNKETEVTNTGGTLQGTLDLIKQITPSCDFIAANYDSRTKDRNVEIDGLKKAKAVLQGDRKSVV